MEDERQQLTDRILAMERPLLRCLRAGGEQDWAAVDLTMPQLKVLFLVVGDAGITMTRLARALGMTFSTATGVVDRLVGQGLVRREHDPDDRRLVLLHPTTEGAELIERLLEIRRARLRQVLDRLSVEDLRLVVRTLDVLHRAAASLAEAQTASTGGANCD